MKTRTIVCCIASLLLGRLAIADQIEYTVDNLGGDRWQYNYTVNNTGSNFISLFSVFFDLGLYANLEVTASPTDWDSIVLQPDPFLPDDGIFDSLSLAPPGIGPGAMLGGFSVAFDFLGIGTPGDQIFEIFDPDTFAFIADGMTVAGTPPPGPSPVPEPATLALFAAGFLLLLVNRRRKRLPGRAASA